LLDSERPVIIWFRKDLRLTDNLALTAAVRSGKPVVACYILDATCEYAGSASRWWLHHSLNALRGELASHRCQLVLRRGATVDLIADLVREVQADAIHVTVDPTPGGQVLEQRVSARVESQGTTLHRHRGALLFDQEALRTAQGKPYQVFTPFWKACLRAAEPGTPCAAPGQIDAFEPRIDSDDLDQWELLPKRPNWAQGFEAFWEPGEQGAHARLETFVKEGLRDYAEQRDRPDCDGTSRLSPHLHFGELSPRQIWHRIRTEMAIRGVAERGGTAYLRELGWREFSYYLLRHWPTLPDEPFRPAFKTFPWLDDEHALTCWQRGQTGYPIVDAGMRQLWHRGWMHNRVRMIVASFLVKHLLIPWQRGAAWFADTLVDADLANNSASWQWVAGCGADAAPYFRIFNPIVQGKKFDPSGDYVRRWLPELEHLPTKYVHTPWEAPDSVLATAGIVLGRDYPEPIIDHAWARQRALNAFEEVKVPT